MIPFLNKENKRKLQNVYNMAKQIDPTVSIKFKNHYTWSFIFYVMSLIDSLPKKENDGGFRTMLYKGRLIIQSNKVIGGKLTCVIGDVSPKESEKDVDKIYFNYLNSLNAFVPVYHVEYSDIDTK